MFKDSFYFLMGKVIVGTALASGLVGGCTDYCFDPFRDNDLNSRFEQRQSVVYEQNKEELSRRKNANTLDYSEYRQSLNKDIKKQVTQEFDNRGFLERTRFGFTLGGILGGSIMGVFILSSLGNSRGPGVIIEDENGRVGPLSS